MTTKQLHSVLMLFVAFGVQGVLQADENFLDQFTDTDLTNPDRVPVTWAPWNSSHVAVDNESLVVSSQQLAYPTAIVPEIDLTDISLRTQLRLRDGRGAGVYTRVNPLEIGRFGYFAFIDEAGEAFVGFDGTGEVIGQEQTDLRPKQEDVILQFDAFGSELQLWLWRAGALPTKPVLSVNDDSGLSGEIRLGVAGLDGPPTAAEFRFVHVSTTHIPIVLPGDFDFDGTLSVTDIDLLATAIGSNDVSFDVNEDGKVNSADHTHWVKKIRQTWFGDANLDGEFNSGDLVDVFVAGKYVVDPNMAETATWAEGDWNGDMLFDSGDLVVAFEDGGYVAGAAPAVPEPTSVMMLVTGVIGVARVLRTRRSRV